MKLRRALKVAVMVAAGSLAVALVLILAVGLRRPPVDPTLEPAFAPAGADPIPRLPRRPANADRQAFFGDLHIHSALSADAFVFGVRAMPDDAYRFAKGAPLAHGNGSEIQLSRPLDFAAVTDHSEFLGITRMRGRGHPDRTLAARTPPRGLAPRASPGSIFQTMRELWANVGMAVPRGARRSPRRMPGRR